MPQSTTLPSPISPAITDSSLLRRLSAGQEIAADVLYARYANRILGLARSRLPEHVVSRIDAEDVAQSVFRAFFTNARQGLYHVPDGETLWQLLAVVTVNKVRSLHTFHSAARRSTRNTEAWADDQVAIVKDGTQELMEVAVRDVLERLPEAERVVVDMRLDGHEVAEIASRTGRSKRSVERLLQRARERLDELLTDAQVSDRD